MGKKDDTHATIAAGASGIAGAAGAIGTVAAAGSVTGLGATGITSGLAAIGAVVGGGMAAGLVATAAAPIAIAGLAYGTVRVAQSFSKTETDKPNIYNEIKESENSDYRKKHPAFAK